MGEAVLIERMGGGWCVADGFRGPGKGHHGKGGGTPRKADVPRHDGSVEGECVHLGEVVPVPNPRTSGEAAPLRHPPSATHSAVPNTEACLSGAVTGGPVVARPPAHTSEACPTRKPASQGPPAHTS